MKIGINIKDLEYYLDRYCACGCGGRIKVQPHHKYYGIPKYIDGHSRKGKRNLRILRETRVCARKGCSNTFECKVNSVQNYCSFSCVGKSNKGRKRIIPREIRTCVYENCNNLFEVPITSTQRWCCISCSNKDKSQRKNQSRYLKKSWQDPIFREKRLKAIYRGF